MDEWWAAKPVYFKRINSPFDQRAGLLVCGIGLTAQMRRGWHERAAGRGQGISRGDEFERSRGKRPAGEVSPANLCSPTARRL